MEIKIRTIEAGETWPLRQKVMWPDREISYVKLPNDEQGIHFGLFLDTQLTSVVSLFVDPREKSAQFRKFATLHSYQGRGLGSKLLKYMLDQAENMGISIIWCNARTNKSGFYQKFGFQTTHKHFEKGGISYVIMQKKVPVR
ncbi:GNAT family N-acetyltransferase [Flexithrix dorotheae]|uniref:GNAT family N-acetyltransferase n=1 Tax=Flexithrix dorotheae TaxID=70993 RepID=UPI001FE19073|nr:GNAT family N-acetyltransferase [Flexithrix dorotheae]